MLCSIPQELAIGHPNDFTLFNYGLLLAVPNVLLVLVLKLQEWRCA